MAQLNKIAFKHFVETECDRRLLWDLGEGDADWIQPFRLRVKPEFERSEAARLGHVWEQKVYRSLRGLPGARAELDHAGDVVTTPFGSAPMAALYAEARKTPQILLEHEWAAPEAFYRAIVGVTPDEPLPKGVSGKSMRPDVLLVSLPDGEAPREVLPDGRLRALPAEECATRLALRVLDVKHTSEHGVGRSHFVELLFYAHALSHWLRRHALEDRFFVSADGHGIIPFTDDPFAGLTLDRVTREVVVPLVWEDVSVLFSRTCERIRTMAATRPHDVDKVDVRVQPGCGACNYLVDCKTSLQRGSEVPGDWDLRLLPYTSPTTADMLRRLEGVDTVRDVAEKLAMLPEAPGYDPLFAERPMLRLKAQAVMQNARVAANTLSLGGQRHLSMALPRFNDLTLLFTLEADPTHDTVFGAALRLEVRCGAKSLFRKTYEAWWAAWRELLNAHPKTDGLAQEALSVRTVLDEAFLATQGAQLPVDDLLREAAGALGTLRSSGALEFPPPREGDEADAPQNVTWTWRYVSGGVDPHEEFELAQDLLEQVSACVTLCNAMESLIGATTTLRSFKGADYTKTSSPSLAIYYWSEDQVQHAQEMLERQVQRINADDKLRRRFQEILQWLSPAESSVTHYQRHQKIFNLRAFVETTQGLPHVINCTWHELLLSEFSWPTSRRYWAPHFNYMDYAVWHTALEEGNQNRRHVQLSAIGDQLQIKLDGLYRILKELRHDMTDSLVLQGAVHTGRMRQTVAGGDIHPLARTWYMFARLNAAAAQLKVDDVRYSYPSRGIGRLYAAEATALEALQISPGHEHGGVTFDLHGMSAEVRFKEGDRLLLVPECLRERANLDDWKVELLEMRYDATRRCYVCKATAISKEFLAEFAYHGDAIEQGPVYLYPTSLDIWSGRLLDNKDGFLKRLDYRIGKSWLGHRASFLMGLQTGGALPSPKTMTFSLAEAYLFAPRLLPAGSLDGSEPLRTTAWPPPDPSQQTAIRKALGSTVTCLQGPPGTGKSQTLAALVDEFLARATGPVRVLITAFSYEAMVVLAKKLVEQRDIHGAPTLAAKVQKIMVHSPDRDPPLVAPNVLDLAVDSSRMVLDGNVLSRLKSKRLEDYVAPSFVMFANAHSLYRMSQPSGLKSMAYTFVKDDFSFDLVIVDEASQLPTDQFLSCADFLHPGTVTARFTDATPEWSRPVPRLVEAMAFDGLPARRSCVVVVGDQHQLPPVQPVKPPRKLQKVLGSLFHYLIEGHGLPTHQLQVNYRSTDTIVDITRSLGLYLDLRAFRKDTPYAPLPAVPAEVEAPWLRAVLDPASEVHAMVHTREGERSTSDLEAIVAADTVAAFFAQMGVTDADSERVFWTEHVGVVAPHNAQGRRIMLGLKARLATTPRRSFLDDAELDQRLRHAVCSVEKFQGSDRTFILASMGISARDQLSAEEAFIFGINRFNVLSSRAKQKMLLLCSRTFLDYIPRDRDVMADASRIRAYALDFCDTSAQFSVRNERGEPEAVTWRRRSSTNV